MVLDAAAALDVLVLVAERPQEHRDAGDRGEQDELLAEGVPGAQVEVEAGHDVRRPAQVRLDPVDEQPVGGVQVAEMRQTVKADQQHRPQSGSGEREQAEPHPRAHRGSSSAARSCERILRSAARMMSGRPTPETTISESATSGASKTKNKSVSAKP